MDTKQIEELIARMKAGDIERAEAIEAINRHVPQLQAEQDRLKGLMAQLNNFKNLSLTYADYFGRVRKARR